jgi:hypothetical protein
MAASRARKLVLGAQAVTAIVTALAASGCGASGGQLKNTTEYAGLDEYTAISEARNVVYEESGDSRSPAHGRPLVVMEATHGRFDDGTPAWRIEFMTLDKEPAGVCAWVAQKRSTPLRETIEYLVDRC